MPGTAALPSWPATSDTAVMHQCMLTCLTAWSILNKTTQAPQGGHLDDCLDEGQRTHLVPAVWEGPGFLPPRSGARSRGCARRRGGHGLLLFVLWARRPDSCGSEPAWGILCRGPAGLGPCPRRRCPPESLPARCRRSLSASVEAVWGEGPASRRSLHRGAPIVDPEPWATDPIIDAVSAGMWICNGEANALRVNAASCRLSGWSPEWVAGRNLRDLGREFSSSGPRRWTTAVRTRRRPEDGGPPTAAPLAATCSGRAWPGTLRRRHAVLHNPAPLLFPEHLLPVRLPAESRSRVRHSPRTRPGDLEASRMGPCSAPWHVPCCAVSQPFESDRFRVHQTGKEEIWPPQRDIREGESREQDHHPDGGRVPRRAR